MRGEKLLEKINMKTIAEIAKLFPYEQDGIKATLAKWEGMK